jgi:hypothetical protein
VTKFKSIRISIIFVLAFAFLQSGYPNHGSTSTSPEVGSILWTKCAERCEIQMKARNKARESSNMASVEETAARAA